MCSKEKLIVALFKLDKDILDEVKQVLSEWDNIFSNPESKEGLTEEQITEISSIFYVANTYDDEVVIYALAKLIGEGV